MKLIFWILGSLLALFITVLPELVMYFTYSLINPTSEAAKIVILLGFWTVGGGLCVFTAFLGFVTFLSVTKVATE